MTVATHQGHTADHFNNDTKVHLRNRVRKQIKKLGRKHFVLGDIKKALRHRKVSQPNLYRVMRSMMINGEVKVVSQRGRALVFAASKLQD